MRIAAPSFEQSALALAWLALILLAFAMSGLMRQVHALTLAVHGRRPVVTTGPEVGTVVPDHPKLRGAHRIFLLFADPKCQSCETAIQMLSETVQKVNANGTSRKAGVVFRNRESVELAGEPSSGLAVIAPGAHGRFKISIGC